MSQDLPKLLHIEARVLGVLIEKSLTMPDSYPLSINALANGANQKSNRHPETNFSEGEVFVAVEGLIPKGLAGRVVPAGSRVEKFRHTASDRLRAKPGELAVLCELLVRGPQSPGELRARVNRMVSTPSLTELMPHIEGLMDRGLAKRIPPAPGSRAERYVQLISPDLHPLDVGQGGGSSMDSSSGVVAAPRLEARVDQLERELAQLRRRFEELLENLGA